LAGFSLTKITLLKFGFYSNLTSIFVALSIIVSYNFIRYYEIKTKRLNWFKKWFFKYKIALFILVILSVIGLVFTVFFTNFKLKSLLILLPFLLMTLFYVVPIVKIGNYEFSFRNFPGIKIFSIAIAWAGITVLFPLFEVGMGLNSTIFIEFIQRIFILIAITIPFDIRDLKSDSKSLKTLPQILSVKKTKILGFGLLLIFILLIFLKENYSNNAILITVIIAVVTAAFVWFSSEEKTRYYASFWVEAIPIFWLILIVLFL
jgi:hypothetical protein